jgi:hypothetical protein
MRSGGLEAVAADESTECQELGRPMRQPDRPEQSVSPVLGPMGGESSTPFRTREVADRRRCVGRKLGRGPAERTGRASRWMDDNPAHVFAWPMLTAMTEIPEGSAMRSAPHPTQARPTPAAGRIMGPWRRPTREPRLKAPRPLPWMRHLVRPRWATSAAVSAIRTLLGRPRPSVGSPCVDGLRGRP